MGYNKFMDRILLIDKPAGWTSFDVVAKIRGIASKQAGRKIKVGHAGTLDPFATGLLIVLLGDATKRQEKYMKLDKEYVATISLGMISSTGDPEGEIKKVLTTNYDVPGEDDVSSCLDKFIGEIEQVPPRHSAIKVDGKRAYTLAREGVEFELGARIIKVHSLDALSYIWPELKISVSCSSGTYVRTLAEDIGEELGCGAYLTALRRTKIGKYQLDDALTIDDTIKEIMKEYK
jgi:tRNA pseudouridine55 synthase